MENPVRRSAAPVGEEDLAALESVLDLTLPADYRAFLLAHNGGVPRRTAFRHVGKKGQQRETWVRWIYSVGRDGLIDPVDEDVITEYHNRPAGLPAGMLPVASAWFTGNTGFVCLSCAGPDAGKVFFRPNVEPSKDTLYPVADSWTAFLGGMVYEGGRPMPWKEAILDGDAARLRAWLEANRAWWKEDRAHSLDVERAAVDENNMTVVRTLVELGFDADSLFEEALGDHRFDIAMELVRGGKVSEQATRNCLTRDNPYLWRLPPLLEELLAAGADIDAQGDVGKAPLHRAVEARSEDGVRLLLDRGADPTVKDDDGQTPRKLAAGMDQKRLAEILKEAQTSWKSRKAGDEPQVVPFDFRGVTMAGTGPKLTLDDIEAFESKIGLTFPSLYRGFLLAANGGVPSPNGLPVAASRNEDDEDEDDEPGIDPTVRFLPLRATDAQGLPVDDSGMMTSIEEAREWSHEGEEMPRGTIPIGTLDGYGYEGSAYLLLACKGKKRGELFAFEYGAEPLGLTLAGLFDAWAAAKDGPKSPAQRLAEAVAAKDLPAVRAALADGANPRAGASQHRGPLVAACEAGFDDAVVAMAEAGTHPDHLMEVVLMTGRVALARRLLEHGGGPSKEVLERAMLGSPDVFTDVDFIKACTARGVDLRKRFGKVPSYLIQAALSGSVNGLKQVLETTRLDPTYRDDQGNTLLHFAAVSASEGAAETIRFLLGLGVRPNQPTASGHTALHNAVMNGNAASAKALIDAGEDLHAKHDTYVPGMTAEQSAARAERVARMAQMMLGHLRGGPADDDGPPPPDPSDPLGQKMAELRASFNSFAERAAGTIEAKLAERAAGGWGKGPSAAEFAARMPGRQTLIAELEAYAAARRPPLDPA